VFSEGISGSSAAGGESAVFDFPRCWPAMNIATTTPITPNAIRTQTHHDGPPPESVVAGVVCVTCALTEVDFVTDVVAAGFVVVWVSVVLLADWVLLVSSLVALETAPVAAFAALDAALLADPDPQPLSSAVAMPSASAATTIGRRAVNLTVVSPLIAARFHNGYVVFGVVTQSCLLLLSASSYRCRLGWVYGRRGGGCDVSWRLRPRAAGARVRRRWRRSPSRRPC